MVVKQHDFDDAKVAETLLAIDSLALLEFAVGELGLMKKEVLVAHAGHLDAEADQAHEDPQDAEHRRTTLK